MLAGNLLKLPSKPHDQEYEDFIASYLLAAGYHVERKLIKREKKIDVLELDIVTTNYFGKSKNVFEIKSGGWGLSDLHKMFGWRNFYCNLHSTLVYLKGLESGMTAANAVATNYDIELVDDTDATLSALKLCYPPLVGKYNSSLLAIIRFSFLVERAMEQEISNFKKYNRDKPAYTALSEFYHNVRNYSFFQPSPITRASNLIDLFRANRNITGRLANINADGTLPDDIDLRIPSDRFRQLFYQCQTQDILYVSLLAELSCRMTVLKSVVDHIILGKSTPMGGTQDFMQRLEEAIVNKDLNAALSELSGHKYVAKYPHFWQIFIYVFGGFIMKEFKGEEYEKLSEMTDIPVEEINNALSAFDILFPHAESWMIYDRNSQIRMMKLFPVPLRGPGVIARKMLFCDSRNIPFNSRYSNWYALNDFKKWLNLSFKYIESIVQRIPLAQNKQG